MAESTSFIKNDETVKKWIKEITETESLLKRMQNELEVEQAKGKLVVSEMGGDILKLEELINTSMSNEKNRLKTLMVNQLIEINKGDVLANIYKELLKQRETFLKELPESFGKHNETSTDDGEKTEIQLFDEAEDETKIEEDILQIEGKIVETEKEQISLKQCLIKHQEVLDELKILEEFTNSNEPPLDEVTGRNTLISEDEFQPRRNLRDSSQNNGDPHTPNLNRNPASEASTMNVITREHRVTEDTFQYKKAPGTYYGPYNAIGKNSAFVLKTAKRMNPVGLPSDSSKRTKLDLYDVSAKAPTTPIGAKNDEASASVIKTAPAFKPKTPSNLRRMVN